MKNNKIISLSLVLLMSVFHPANLVFAADGDAAEFTFVPLNGKQGENEVKLVVDTDNAEINHLIFDIVDTGGSPVFDVVEGSSAISFPLHNNSVLGTETAFTTASGDAGYDLASSNPANIGSYSALHFTTIIADKDLPTGGGGDLSYDTDTAIYVNAQRVGTLGSAYTVLPNQAPEISSPEIGGLDASLSTVAPSFGDSIPSTLITDVEVDATFSFLASDATDASVYREAKIYKKNDVLWTYETSVSWSRGINRSGTDMMFSRDASGLDYSSYYKVVFLARDDQGAEDTATYYFSTQADNNAPEPIDKADMTFIGESETRAKVIAQISFTPTTDNDDIDAYYIWADDYLQEKNILDAEGERHMDLDTNSSSIVSDEELFVALRELVDDGNYIEKVTKAEASSLPYARIRGNDADRVDNNGTVLDDTDDINLVSHSISKDIFYLVAADTAENIAGEGVPNFSDFKVVTKLGDVFGAQVSVTVAGTDYEYVTGDGSLDVWDAVYLYRNIIGRGDEFPVVRADMMYSDPYNLPDDLTTSGANSTN